MKRLLILGVLIVSGCTTATPEMRKVAEQRKGEQHKIEVKLVPEDNVTRRCGYLSAQKAYECTQNILQRKIEEEAVNYCVFYGPYKIKWEMTQVSNFNRASGASTTVTCTGTRQQSAG
jgi:hypothetical protein